MSREREKQRKKRDELARQLGVGRSEVEQRKELQERERVTRPTVRLVSRKPAGGLLRRLLESDQPLVLALYLVEAKGPRLVKALVLDAIATGALHELDKLVYHRPAHFVVVVVPTGEPGAVVDALARTLPRVDGHEVGSAELASEAWEAPRLVAVTGLGAALRGSAVSIRGVGRTAAHYELRLENTVATVEVAV